MVIRIDTQQVRVTSNQFQGKRGDLEALVSQSRSMVNNLKGQFTGKRAQAIFGEWESMQPNLKAAIETLQAASNLLRRAADEFEQVDARK